MENLQGQPFPETTFVYSSELRMRYRKGYLFPEWDKTYCERYPFREEWIAPNRQIPRPGCTPKDCLFFHEFFVATSYLDAGFEVLMDYHETRRRRTEPEHAVAEGLLTAAYRGLIRLPRGGQPDLLVFDPSTRLFRFVETKGPKETFTRPQQARFRQIEALLSKRLPGAFPLGSGLQPNLFPGPPSTTWIHIARVQVESQ